ncbi:prolyl-tRNA synthetase associated domain-containing protein (plasmid) [Streptomyces sp. BI20]|uniref:prolyl-tRNA synthetase associated domain-containing protein n=1 Tax=Streptomyces sp. BI20 TaxID=3403460 RepID=UPI003C722BD7
MDRHGPSAPDPTRDAAEAALTARLDELGIPWETVRHEAVYTVAEARRLRGAHTTGGHAKNLFLKDRRKRLHLAVIEQTTPVDLKALGRAVGAPGLSFASPATLAEVLDVTPGSVTPFAAMNAAPGTLGVILDAALLTHDPLHFHPLRNDATTTISPKGLLAFLESCGHTPTVLDLTTLAPTPPAGAH